MSPVCEGIYQRLGSRGLVIWSSMTGERRICALGAGSGHGLG